MTTALILVDVQNDFIEGGRLPVTGGVAAARAISEMATDASWDVVVASRDWHTSNTHGHFAADGDEPDFVDTWPVHCMADTGGAELSSWLTHVWLDATFNKGQSDAAYSAFEGISVEVDPATAQKTNLADYLRRRNVTDVVIVGIATDFCVKATALDAVKEGFNTTVRTDLTAAVNAPLSDGRTTLDVALEQMAAAGVTLADGA